MDNLHSELIPYIIPRRDIVQTNNKWTTDWQSETTIELSPSFKVRESNFAYYNGEKKSEIRMKTSKHRSCIHVRYGDVGVDMKTVMYSKTVLIEERLNPKGGKAKFCHVDSLFDWDEDRRSS